VICQSVRTADRITDLVRGRVPVHAIAPGLDHDQWNRSATQHPVTVTPDNGKVSFLYLGTASHIRGFYILLRAMQKLVRDEPGMNAELIVLARGADPERTRTIETEIAAHGISSAVRIIGGWLDRAELMEHIGKATAVVLPFVLVPSELPVTAMEVIACGTPVIATDVDGLPDAVGKAGTIVPAGNAKALAKAMQYIARNPAVPAGWRQAAQEQTARMESWDAITARWLKVFEGA
jgi:glycosyltransferase involved in cell wall biosynthesis